MMDGRTDGRTDGKMEGQKAENCVPLLSSKRRGISLRLSSKRRRTKSKFNAHMFR